MKKIEIYETDDGDRFDRANDAEAYELLCELAKAITPAGFGNLQQNWKDNLPLAVLLVKNQREVAPIMARILLLSPSENFHELKVKRPR